MLIEILSIIISLTSLLLALLQTIRLRGLRRKDEAVLWGLINTSKRVINNLENSKLIDSNSNVAKAYSQTILIHEQIIGFLALREKKFTNGTIEHWKKANKITNSWQEDQARKFLDI